MPTKLRSRIELQVNPKVRMIWDELTLRKRNLIKKAFEKMVMEVYLGADDPVLEELDKMEVVIRYDEKTLEVLKELIESNDKERKWIREVKDFLQAFYEMDAISICGDSYRGIEPILGRLKKLAKQLLDEAP